jgi:hypothetical protein
MTTFDPSYNVIHCDQDGVLADFDLYKKTHLSSEAQTDDDQMWAEIKQISGFYRKLKATPYARKLWDAIKLCGSDRCILTALPRKSTMPDADTDKRLWVNDNRSTVFGGDKPTVKFGPYSKDKHKHAEPGDILIDDRLDNIEQWIAAGGIGIHHTGNVEQTIRLLHEAAGLI